MAKSGKRRQKEGLRQDQRQTRENEDREICRLLEEQRALYGDVVQGSFMDTREPAGDADTEEVV